MPPKKRAETRAQPRAGSSDPTRSTRSRTRSATPSATNAKPRNRTRVKTEPVEHDACLLALAKGDAHGREVWDWNDQNNYQCWVELPAWPYPGCEQDQLMFLRPSDAAAWRANGKGKAKAKKTAVYSDPTLQPPYSLFCSEADLKDEDGYVVAIRPRTTMRKGASRSASTAPSSNKGKGHQKEAESQARPSDARKVRDGTEADPTMEAATDETGHPPEPIESAEAASGLQSTQKKAQKGFSSQSNDNKLEDMFLDSSQEASEPLLNGQSRADDGGAPLFFDNRSDNDDHPRNEPPATTRTLEPHRARAKVSPSYGDRIARPFDSTQAQARTVRSRSPTRTAASKSSASQRKDDTVPGRKKSKKQRGEDVKDLRSELNEDAFTRSTGARQREEYRNKLVAFSQARKKARLERGEEEDSSTSGDEGNRGDNAKSKEKTRTNGVRTTSISSGSSSSSSSSSDSRDFIVGDDEIEYDQGYQPDAASPQKVATKPAASSALRRDGKRCERDSDGRIRLMAISETKMGSSSSSVLAAHGLVGVGGRKGLDEMCLDWLEWAVARVLVTWSSISLSDRERLECGRAALKSRMRSLEETVFSVAMRRQFKWYLTEYPRIGVEALFSDEFDRSATLAKQGCGICHRRSPRPRYMVTFGGERYNQTTLAPLEKRKRKRRRQSSGSSDSDDNDNDSDSDSDSDTASDRSSDTETWREEGQDERGRRTFTFFAGNHCAQRAAVMHELHHWEWTTMQSVAKHESIRFVRRLLWRADRNGRGRDGKMGAGAWEVAFCVGEMISPSGKCKWKCKSDASVGRDAEGTRRKSGRSQLDSLRKRLKTLVDAAIEVNGAS